MTTTLSTTVRTLVVGISDLKLSSDPNELLVTYSLGSCIGVTMFDPVARVGGMIHCMLPLSKTDPARAERNPAMFTDTGILTMLGRLYDMGAQKHRLKVKAAGGAAPLDNCGRFKIGERNYTVMRKVLWKNDILIAAEDIGGTTPRTLRLSMADGQTRVKTNEREFAL